MLPYSKKNTDFLGIYCPETDRCYLMPIEEVPPGESFIRVLPSKNNQVRGIKWAKSYEI